MLSFTSRGRLHAGERLAGRKIIIKATLARAFPLLPVFRFVLGAKPAIRGTEELVSSNVPPISFLLSYFCTF